MSITKTLDEKVVYTVWRNTPMGDAPMGTFEHKEDAEVLAREWNAEHTHKWDVAYVEPSKVYARKKERVGLKIVELFQQLTNMGYSISITKVKEGMRIICKLNDHDIVQLNTVVTGKDKELEKKIIATLEDFRKDVED